MKKLDVLIKRLDKIGIKIELSFNFPYIYLIKVNTNNVIETFYGNHGFTIGFYPIREDEDISFTDIKYLFKTIRKYK